MAQNYAKENRATFLETSARLNKGVSDLFQRAALEGLRFNRANQMLPKSPRRRPSAMVSPGMPIEEEDEEETQSSYKSCCAIS